MKIIIAGTRTFTDYELLKRKCDAILAADRDYEIVSGCANGADALGERYATEKGYKIKRFPADWERLGKSAGPVRNEQMAQYADAAIIFWDGKSVGAKNMISLAEKYRRKVRIIRY